MVKTAISIKYISYACTNILKHISCVFSELTDTWPRRQKTVNLVNKYHNTDNVTLITSTQPNMGGARTRLLSLQGSQIWKVLYKPFSRPS